MPETPNMDAHAWTEIATVLAAYCGLVLTVTGILHKRRTDQFRKFENNLDKLAAELRTHQANDITDHRAMGSQIQDMARSIAGEYIRREELRVEFAEVREMIVEMRKDMGADFNALRDSISETNRRTDELFRNVQWRPAGRT